MTLECQLIAEDIMDFAAEVRKLRDDKGWSQHELAEKAGISRSSIARAESGVSNVATMEALNLISLAKAFELHPLYFFFGGGLLTEDEVINFPIEKIMISKEEKRTLETIIKIVTEFQSAKITRRAAELQEAFDVSDAMDTAEAAEKAKANQIPQTMNHNQPGNL